MVGRLPSLARSSSPSLYAPGTAGQPGLRGSPSPMKVEPRWMPLSGRKKVLG